MEAHIHVGTSGWHYRHWIGTFYPAKLPLKRMFVAYLEHFDTVELNNSFYHMPLEKTFENWAAKVPEGFVFSVKVSRYITHLKRLLEPEEPFALLLERCRKLGIHLGPLLFQLPPRFDFDAKRLEGILRLIPDSLQATFEFRDRSWMNNESLDLLKQHNVAFCIYELAGFESPHHVTADYAYVRLHGPTKHPYRGSYSEAQLTAWAEQIHAWSPKLKDIYIYFDNDVAGFAAKNALRLRELLKIESPASGTIELAH